MTHGRPLACWVTGLGAVSPMGTGVEAFWSGLLAGKDAIGEIASFDTSTLERHRGGEVRDPAFKERGGLASGHIRGRGTQMAVAAAREAIRAAGLEVGEDVEPGRVGVVLGATMGELVLMNEFHLMLWKQGLENGRARELAGALLPDRIAATVAVEVSAEGPQAMVPNACAAGNAAIVLAMNFLKRGEADVVIVGGVDPFSELTHIGFERLGALAKDFPRPFDRDRSGMVVAEGAGMLVLERAEFAKTRGRTPLATVLGGALSADAHHMTSPDPEGRGVARAIVGALRAAGLTSGDVDYISAHGTGTPANDRAEAKAIATSFGPRAEEIPVSSIKSMIGHAMGASGALEAVACVLALRHGWIPPTIHFQTPDPECPLDVVPNAARQATIQVAMNNSFGFGGANSVVLFGR